MIIYKLLKVILEDDAIGGMNMKVAIHQPHYFPWVGYLDKMAHADKFILLDKVQLEKGSYMYRNRILSNSGKICYLTVSAEKHGFLDKEYKEIVTRDNETWMPKQIAQLENAYAKSPYFSEVWEKVKLIFNNNSDKLCDIAINSIEIIRDILEIETEIITQSSVHYDETVKKNDLVLALCKAVDADVYISGNGARAYMNEASFIHEGIEVIYQKFNVPEYQQHWSSEFVPGLSILDMLFNCGIEQTKKLFWDNIRK